MDSHDDSKLYAERNQILLMFVSGLPLQERPGAKKRYENGNHWDSYRRWTERTSILVPLPPQVYAKVPVLLKRTLLLEFPIYVFNPSKHADLRATQDRQVEEGNEDSDSNGQRESSH